jgi:PIN domain nuclease of toxin-antitoxin system
VLMRDKSSPNDFDGLGLGELACLSAARQTKSPTFRTAQNAGHSQNLRRTEFNAWATRR